MNAHTRLLLSLLLDAVTGETDRAYAPIDLVAFVDRPVHSHSNSNARSPLHRFGSIVDYSTGVLLQLLFPRPTE